MKPLSIRGIIGVEGNTSFSTRIKNDSTKIINGIFTNITTTGSYFKVYIQAADKSEYPLLSESQIWLEAGESIRIEFNVALSAQDRLIVWADNSTSFIISLEEYS